MTSLLIMMHSNWTQRRLVSGPITRVPNSGPYYHVNNGPTIGISSETQRAVCNSHCMGIDMQAWAGKHFASPQGSQ